MEFAVRVRMRRPTVLFLPSLSLCSIDHHHFLLFLSHTIKMFVLDLRLSLYYWYVEFELALIVNTLFVLLWRSRVVVAFALMQRSLYLVLPTVVNILQSHSK